MLADLVDVRSAFNALEAASIVTITDDKGIIIDVNDQFCEISKYMKAELIGYSHPILNSEFYSVVQYEDLQETLSKGRVWKGEMKNYTKDGYEYWLDLIVVPIVAEHRAGYHYMSIGTDITHHKQKEVHLLHTLDNLRDIENALDESSIVAITDDKGVITYINDKFCEISKYDRHELVGRTHRVINSRFHPKSFFKEMWDTIRAGQVWKGEVKNRAKDGSEYWMNTTIVPFLNEEGKPHQFISIRMDITDRVLADAELAERTEQLAKARDEAIQSSLIKSQFLANMSHELRTPLNAIIGYSEMLQEEAEELGEPLFAEDLNKISRAGNHLLALINDILDISKIEAGKMELDSETYALPSLIQDVLTTIQPLVDGKGNKLQTIGKEEGEITVDITKLRQILINLLSNANKFTEAGSITFEIDRERRGDRDGISFRVSDTGIGITSEQMEKLFQPFTQADASTTRKYGGTGLGLVISQRFIHFMGGDIEVESVFGVGSTFTCWLPTSSNELKAHLANELEAKKLTEQHESPVSILLIDDEPMDRELLERYLAKTGWTLAFATSGLEGLRLARSMRPKVICLDILMPDMNGWIVLEALKGDPELSDIPVVIWSVTDDKQQGLSLGAAENLSKPIDRERMIQVLRKYIVDTEVDKG